MWKSVKVWGFVKTELMKQTSCEWERGDVSGKITLDLKPRLCDISNLVWDFLLLKKCKKKNIFEKLKWLVTKGNAPQYTESVGKKHSSLKESNLADASGRAGSCLTGPTAATRPSWLSERHTSRRRRQKNRRY